MSCSTISWRDHNKSDQIIPTNNKQGNPSRKGEPCTEVESKASSGNLSSADAAVAPPKNYSAKNQIHLHRIAQIMHQSPHEKLDGKWHKAETTPGDPWAPETKQGDTRRFLTRSSNKVMWTEVRGSSRSTGPQNEK